MGICSQTNDRKKTNNSPNTFSNKKDKETTTTHQSNTNNLPKENPSKVSNKQKVLISK